MMRSISYELIFQELYIKKKLRKVTKRLSKIMFKFLTLPLGYFIGHVILFYGKYRYKSYLHLYIFLSLYLLHLTLVAVNCKIKTLETRGEEESTDVIIIC